MASASAPLWAAAAASALRNVKNSPEAGSVNIRFFLYLPRIFP
jgi:hypothetical protein